jgi:DNA-directed RNA polymerase subunit E'/Rpb7
MMVHAAVVALSAFVVVTHAYNFNSLARIARASNAIRAEAPASRVAISKQSSWVKLFATVEEPEVDTPAPMGGDDFLQYAVGQQYDAVVTNAKNYGVFAKITSTGFSVLLPRMKMSPQNFAKLKGAVEAKSEDPVRIEILNVDSENRTLSAKYIPSSGSQDIAKLKDMNLKAETFEATVVSAHDFGVFAKLDKEDFEGLIPASKLPDSMPQGTIKESYP